MEAVNDGSEANKEALSDERKWMEGPCSTDESGRVEPDDQHCVKTQMPIKHLQKIR